MSSPHNVQGQWRVKKLSLGLENFVPVVAYHFCFNLPGKFSQPWAHFLAQPCNNDRCPTFISSSVILFLVAAPAAPDEAPLDIRRDSLSVFGANSFAKILSEKAAIPLNCDKNVIGPC